MVLLLSPMGTEHVEGGWSVVNAARTKVFGRIVDRWSPALAAALVRSTYMSTRGARWTPPEVPYLRFRDEFTLRFFIRSRSVADS